MDGRLRFWDNYREDYDPEQHPDYERPVRRRRLLPWDGNPETRPDVPEPRTVIDDDDEPF